MSHRDHHALYRFYDATGTLLYIGITADPGARWRQHAREKTWWHEVTQIHLEVLPTRTRVLDAERRAIKAERPRYNILHNHGTPGGRRPVPRPSTVPTDSTQPYTVEENLWTYTTHRSGYEHITDLYLDWEIDGTPMSDDWTPEEITAPQLLARWADRYGAPTVDIYWHLTPIYETAPFQPRPIRQLEHDFLDFFTWPVSARTGELLNFIRLPVVDQAWNDAYATKGGFFQEATGWRPGPLQPSLNVTAVLAAARLPIPKHLWEQP